MVRHGRRREKFSCAVLCRSNVVVVFVYLCKRDSCVKAPQAKDEQTQSVPAGGRLVVIIVVVQILARMRSNDVRTRNPAALAHAAEDAVGPVEEGQR